MENEPVENISLGAAAFSAVTVSVFSLHLVLFVMRFFFHFAAVVSDQCSAFRPWPISEETLWHLEF